MIISRLIISQKDLFLPLRGSSGSFDDHVDGIS